MSDKTASKAAMEALHGELAKVLTGAIREGVMVTDKETGETHKNPAPAAILSVARQFLKDNNIDSVGNADTNDLEQAMKDMNDLPMPGEVPEEYQGQH
jgi:hypothetical protein